MQETILSPQGWQAGWPPRSTPAGRRDFRHRRTRARSHAALERQSYWRPRRRFPIQVAIKATTPIFQASAATRSTICSAGYWAGGPACGIAGGLFGRTLYLGATAFAPAKWREHIRRHPLITAALIGILLAAIGTLLPRQNLRHRLPRSRPSFLRYPRSPRRTRRRQWFSTILTYWTGTPGGIFTPSLTIGAVLGERIATPHRTRPKHPRPRPHLHGSLPRRRTQSPLSTSPPSS